MQLIGQQLNLDIISKWNKFPNFLIIQGEEHTGKNYFLLYLCKLYKLHYIKVPISVKNIRELISQMVVNSNTVYHLDNFDKASPQAKSALLKITEEPMPGNYIVITGGPQIATLRSRARLIIMSPYKYEELNDLYSRYYPELDSLKLFKAGINTPAKIEYYKDCTQLKELLDSVYSIFSKITYIEAVDYIPILKLFSNRYEDDEVDICMLYINMLLQLISEKMLSSGKYSYYDILEVILKIKKQLSSENTLNRRLLLFKMFYEINSLHNSEV